MFLLESKHRDAVSFDVLPIIVLFIEKAAIGAFTPWLSAPTDFCQRLRDIELQVSPKPPPLTNTCMLLLFTYIPQISVLELISIKKISVRCIDCKKVT